MVEGKLLESQLAFAAFFFLLRNLGYIFKKYTCFSLYFGLLSFMSYQGYASLWQPNPTKMDVRLKKTFFSFSLCQNSKLLVESINNYSLQIANERQLYLSSQTVFLQQFANLWCAQKCYWRQSQRGENGENSIVKILRW